MVLTYPIFCCPSSRWRLVYFIVFAMNLVTCRNFYWTPSSNTSKWYSPLDLCLLSNSSKIQIEVIMADCRRKVTEAVASKMPVRCTLGNSWPSSSGFCSSLDMPYTERDTFQNAAIGYDDPSSHPLRNFFRQLSKEKGSVLLIGDSVMQQFFSAIACELEREGIWDDPNQFQNTDELKLVNIGGPSSLMHAVPIKFTPIYHFVNGRYDRVVNASMVAMKKSVEEFLKLYKSVYIVINMGLHYVPNPEKHHARPDYRKQMAMALRYLHSVAIDHPGVRIFWRETSAQHFRTSNGYYPGKNFLNGMQMGCVPLNDSTPEADWRNQDISDIIIKHNLFTVKVIPFYNLTAPLWNVHVDGYKQDCTHFCWTPMLYQPLFHYLADSVVPSRFHARRV